METVQAVERDTCAVQAVRKMPVPRSRMREEDEAVQGDEMNTATDELRELLDERGVEWDDKTYEGATFWNEETNLAIASDGGDGRLWVSQLLTPEQAVAATLGSEREKELESLAADMFRWLADYITPQQYAMWEARLEDLDVRPLWRWAR